MYRLLDTFIFKLQRSHLSSLIPRAQKDWIKNLVTQRKYSYEDVPSQIVVELSSICNNAVQKGLCVYCPNNSARDYGARGKTFMDDKLFDKIVLECKEFANGQFSGIFSFNHYNEPLAPRKGNKFYIVEKVRQVKFHLPLVKVDIFTNGFYLDGPMFKLLIDAGVDRIILTYHHTKIENGSTIENYPAARDNLMKFRQDNPRYNKAYTNRVTETTLSEFTNRAGDVDSNLEKYNLVEQKEDPCQAYRSMVIDYAGKVAYCSNDFFSGDPLGDVTVNHLKDVWNDANYKMFRTARETMDLDNMGGICKECNVYKQACH